MNNSRRKFLKSGALLLPLLCLGSYGNRTYAAGEPRQLDFYHTHTLLSLSIIYHDGKDYIPQALKEIDDYLADYRNGKIHPINPGVLDILYTLRNRLNSTGVYEVISAYRSPQTNAMLRMKGKGVAKNSLHMQGKAIDVRLRGVDTARLRDAAIKLRQGGVGYYRASDFVHVDVGRFRTW